MKILCIGQMGWDITFIDEIENRNYGGSVLHFSLAAALMGIKIDILCYVNKKEWSELIDKLHQIGIGTNNIIDFEDTIRFNMYYDKQMNFCEDKFSMYISECEPLIYEKISDLKLYDIYNLCETVPEQDFKTLRKIKECNKGAVIAMQFHIDNLFRNKSLYLSLLSDIDYVFMNSEEVLFLFETGSIDEAIPLLRKYIKNIIFITSHMQNYAINRKEIVVIEAIETNDVIDPTGAGDCFAGGAIAGLCLNGQLDTALRYGSICSYFKLKGYSSNHLLEMLKIWRY